MLPSVLYSLVLNVINNNINIESSNYGIEVGINKKNDL